MMDVETFGGIQLVNGDCMDVMRELPDNAFDLAIIDPPYGIKADKEAFSRNNKRSRKALTHCNIYKKDGWDKEAPTIEYFKELFRISTNQIIFGANHFISKIPYDSNCWIVWDKDNGTNTFADCELAWTSFSKAVRKFKWRWHGMLQEDMKNKEQRVHPTQKPEALYRWLLMNYAKPGQRIIDTHLGAGSICLAAHELGFEMLGIEIDPYYYNIAKQRLLNKQAQLKLF